MPLEIPRRSGRLAQRPLMFSEWSKRFPTQSTNIAAAVKALVGGYETVYAAHERFSRDESSTPGARIVKSARHARTKLEPMMDGLDAAINYADGSAAQLRAKVTECYRPKNPSMETLFLGQEIRQQFRAMNPGQIAAALEDAEKSGNHEVLQAISCYDARLSGTPAQLHEWARNVLIQARAPQEAAALKTLDEQLTLAKGFKAEMLASLAHLIDFQKAAEIEAAAQADVA